MFRPPLTNDTTRETKFQRMWGQSLYTRPRAVKKVDIIDKIDHICYARLELDMGNSKLGLRSYLGP